jgi:hypothetical protein
LLQKTIRDIFEGVLGYINTVEVQSTNLSFSTFILEHFDALHNQINQGITTRNTIVNLQSKQASILNITLEEVRASRPCGM